MNHIMNGALTGVNRVGRMFCDHAGDVFIQSAVLVIVLLALDLLLRKRLRAVLRYCVWMLVLIKLALPPTLSLPTGIGYWVGGHLPAASVPDEAFDTPVPERAEPGFQMSQSRASIDDTGSTTATSPANPVLIPLTWQAVLFVLWLAGVFAFVLVLGQRLKFVRGLVKRSHMAPDELLGVLERCRQQMRVRRDIGLRLSEAISSPAVCGLFGPTILMPATLVKRLSPEGLQATLIHEVAHIKRGDLWVNAVQTVLQVVYFYNPFVWFANAMIRRVCEEAVDETVLVALGGRAKSYSNTLIDIAEMAFWRTDLGLRLIGVAESRKALQWRIRTMLNRPIPKSSKLGVLGTIVILIVAAVLLPMARAEKTSEKSEPVRSDNQGEYTKPLHQAAADGDIEQVRLLISRGADVNEKDRYGRTALHCASWKGHADVARLLISQGARINVTTAMMASTPLHYAAVRGDKQAVKLLLSKGANINAKNRDGKAPLFEAMASTAAGRKEVVEYLVAKGAKVPALHLAAYRGDIEKLKQCLQDGIDINSQADFGCAALHAAANGGSRDVVEFLISKGANVDAKGAYYDLTPLYYAALHNYEDIVDLLLTKGADVNAKDKNRGGFTLLNHAIWDHNKDAVKLLINKGANVNLKCDTHGWTPLFYAIWENDKDIAGLLMSKGADVKAKDNQGLTPLDWAAREGRKDLVELLTPKGAAPAPTIHVAARKGDLGTVKRLIQEGADINANKGGETPLFAAVGAGSNEVAKFLIAQGADVNAPGFGGLTPLFPACVSCDKDVVELLISNGADVNTKTQGDFTGLTPLHTACRGGQKEVVELLISKGADLNAKITFAPAVLSQALGATPLHLGSSLGHKDVVELLVAKGANINARKDNNQTPLHEACSTGQKDVVELLIAKGADVNAEDNKQQTALSLAKAQGHEQIAELLRQHGAKE